METKEKAAKPKAPTKTEKLAAAHAARLAYDEGKVIADNPYDKETQSALCTAWATAWLEMHTVRICENESSTTETAPAIAAGNEQLAAAGHNMTDETVQARANDLANLCDAFDAVGVSIDETQWRALSDEEQSVAARWVNGRKIGAQSPLPICLYPFATEALKSEYAIYVDEQREIRRVIMPCEFGKHSETKPDGDDSEPKIKINIKVPVSDLSAATANDLFGWKRSRVEFGRRDVNTWDQKELPGTGQTFCAIADISGFSRNRTHWKFGFFIAMTEISIEQAYDLWKSRGSCRVEPIGEIPEESNRVDSENPEATDDGEDEPDEVRTPSLFKDEEQAQYVKAAYVIPIKTEYAAGLLHTVVTGGRYYIASDVTISLDDLPENSWGDEYPDTSGDGYVSLQTAIEAEIGGLIDAITEDTAGCVDEERCKPVINELKDYLRFISTGGKPVLAPADQSEDPSY